MFPTLINALRETIVMVLSASAITLLLGLPLGILVAGLATTHNKVLQGIYFILLGILQLAKITPYLLIMVLFIPLSNWFIDHKISYSSATIIPLATTGILLLGFKTYQLLFALWQQWQHTSKALGATKSQALLLILLPESKPELIRYAAKVCSLMVGFSAIAGALGAGGLGQLAIENSINNPQPLFVGLCIVMLITMQQLIDFTGTLFTKAKSVI